MKARQVSLFEGYRLKLSDAVELSLQSLREYGERYRHWAVAFSGGKDSSATVTLVAWAIKNGLVPRPESLAKNVQRMGPLTMEARRYALERVLDIQARAGVDLINGEEESRIRELWELNTWPNGWSGDEVMADVPLDALFVSSDGRIVTQGLLVR